MVEAETQALLLTFTPAVALARASHTAPLRVQKETEKFKEMELKGP